MPRAKSSDRVKIEEAYAKNPNASIDDVMKMTGLRDRKKISNVRTVIQPQNSFKQIVDPKKISVKAESCQAKVLIQIPKDGLELKIAQGGVLFTLDITEVGLMYLANNAKKKAHKRIPWNTIKMVQKL